MGNANKILKDYLEKSRIGVIQFSRDVDVTPGRVYQWLSGETIPFLRIRLWAYDPARPEHVQKLAKQMLKEYDGRSEEVGVR